MSARSTEVLAYLRERYPLSRFLPLAVFLATAGHAGLSSWEPAAWGRSVVLALALVLQFRLWDDLESLGEDRLEHPRRALCQAPSLVPFVGLLVMISALCAVMLGSSPRALAGYALLCVLFLGWYRVIAPRLSRGVLAAHGVLLKYPAFVAILHALSGDGVPPPLVLGLVYLCFCVYELLHDARLLARPGAPAVLRAEMVALWAVSAAMCFALPEHAGLSWVAQLSLCLGAAFALTAIYRRSLSHGGAGSLGAAVFALSFLLTLSFTLRSRS
jgi:hypothetical protein